MLPQDKKHGKTYTKTRDVDEGEKRTPYQQPNGKFDVVEQHKQDSYSHFNASTDLMMGPMLFLMIQTKYHI
jgi:hypothetical protein